jgi:hypothetical protein
VSIGSAAPKAKLGRGERLVERFLQWCCRHEFTWPHTGPHGQDYQTCLNCGAAYEFDCATMTRTGRLVQPKAH